MEAGDRPLVTEPEGAEDVLQDGDSPVGFAVCPNRGLDGVSGLEGRIFAGSDASRISQIPQVRGGREGLPVQGSLLWTLHSSTAPQVFTQVMAPVSAFLHQSGIRLRRYLDDWLIQASSREQVLLALESVLLLCQSLGIVVNWEKSQLIPSQRVEYLGVLLDSVSFRASPVLKRVEKLLSIGEEFLSCERQPVSSWLELLGVLASLIQLVPVGRLRMRSLQFCLRQSWDQADQTILVRWTPEIREDLEWWLDRARLELGISLDQVSPQQELWSDASDVGWGAHLGEELASGLWSPDEQSLSINARELLAIERALSFFRSANSRLRHHFVCGQLHRDRISPESRRDEISAPECDSAENSSFSGVSEGDFSSAIHHGSLQRPGGCTVAPQPDLGFRVNTQSRGFSGSKEEVASFHRSVCHLSQSPMFSVFFAIPRSERLSYGCSAPELEWVAGVCLSSLVTHSNHAQEAPVVLWSPPNTNSSILASTTVVYEASGFGGGWASGSASVPGSSTSAPLSPVPSGGVRAVSSCLETIQRFAQAKGFSKHVTKQSGLARRPSSRAGY